MQVDGKLVCAPDFPVWGIGPLGPTGFKDNGDGSVTHALTGLTWQQAFVGKKTWTDAGPYCDKLTLAGRTDWRLPTQTELLSIVDFTKQSPSIDSVMFPSTQTDHYWTASPGAPAYSGDVFWSCNFVDGYCNVGYPTEADYVRCVSPPTTQMQPPSQRFQVATDGTVTDALTKLTWQQGVSPSGYPKWSDAQAYCSGNVAKLPGDGWRLPNVLELMSLVDHGSRPAIDSTAFPDKTSESFWASTTEYEGDQAATVNFADGGTIFGLTTQPAPLFSRCVR